MDRAFIVILVAAIVGAGILAGGAGLFVGHYDEWTPRAYVLRDGKCWVEPQGDPLYDAHYAQEVNLQNCQSYLVQEQGDNLQAYTDKIEWETEQAKIGVFSLLFVVCSILMLLIIAMIRG